MKPLAEIPERLQQYMDGLRTHDIEKIGGSFAEGIQFVTPVKTMGHKAILAFLQAQIGYYSGALFLLPCG